MKNKLTKVFLGIIMIVSTLFPSISIFALNSDDGLIIDDIVTDQSNENYFVYSSATDPNGATGWANDTKNSIIGGNEAKTQHWVWNSNNEEAKKHTYEFNFVGTGVELYGVKSDNENNFQLDGGSVETNTIVGVVNTPTILYSVKDLPYGRHNVKVTLPTNTSYYGLQVSYAKVYGSKLEEMETTIIPHDKVDGSSNKFTYSTNGWSAMGSSNEHVWSDAPSTSLAASDIWYQVDFVGNKIEVYAGKNRPMGKVEYFIDGESKGKYSLYNSSNINSTLIATFSDLEEGPHTFKAVATGEKDTSSTNSLIDCAKVVVTHRPYLVEEINLAQTTYIIREGSEQQINYTIVPDYAKLDDAKFISNDTSIATVSDSGLISGESKGETTVTLSSKKYNINKTININVQEATANITGSIVDVDSQYTQDRFEEVKNKGLFNTELNVWKNDKAISEIALVSDGSRLKNVTITTNDLVSENNIISKDVINATFIKSTKAYNGSFLGYGSTTRPVPEATESNRSESSDILYQKEPIDMSANKVQPVWIEFNAPSDAKAGTYTTKIQVSADGIKEPLEFTYTIVIKDATLKDASEFKDSFDIELWQYPYSSAEYYEVTPFSDEHFAIMQSSMDIYKSIGGHAITTTISEDAWSGQTYSKNSIHYPSMVKWTKIGDKFSYDFTDFDKWVEFNKKNGIGDKIVLYSIAPWHNSFTYWQNGELVKEPYTVGSERYKNVWRDFLQAAVDHLMEKGWFEESYIGIDERGFSKEAFDLIDSVKNIHDESLKTAGAMDHFMDKRDLALRVSDLNVGDGAAAAHKAEFSQLVKDREAKGFKTTLYSCTEHQPGNFSLSAPVESYWSIINAGKETKGFLRWAYDAWVADPLNDTTHNAFEPGDCFFIYPDEKIASTPTSKSSVRLERMAEGVRDVNKINLILEEIPSLKSDVETMYAKLQYLPITKQAYLTAQQRKAVTDEMNTFKNDLNNLTDRYIQLKNSSTDVVESVEISEGEQLSIQLGSSVQLHSIVKPDNIINNKVIYSSNNSNVLTVDDNGVITTKSIGLAIITVKSVLDGTKTDSIEVKVTRPEIEKEAQVSYYSFDDNNAKDLWGKRDGIINGATFINGKSQNAAKVDASNNITFTESLSIGENDAWTVGYWVKSNVDLSDRTSVLMDKNKDYSFDLKMAANRSSGYHVGKGSGDVLTFTADFEKNQWYYLTWTQSKTEGLSMYVNGKLISNNAWTKSNKAILPLDIIGGTGFDGVIDELKIYNRVLNISEINTIMLINGINVVDTNKTVYIGDTYNIEANLISDNDDKTLTYSSSNIDVAKVDESGIVTALKKGDATITIENKASGYKTKVEITVEKKLNIANNLTEYRLADKYLSDIEKAPGGDRQYLGQPDMVRTTTGKLITAYPKGHGKGPIIMQISTNNGETWIEKTDLPTSWNGSQETPTLYTLKLANGKERIMLITACPGWGSDLQGNSTGWNTSYSDDDGQTWSEYAHWYTKHENGNVNKSIVGMASLVQLKDEQGNYIQKWMGVYHDYDYVNYKTYLTFDKSGNEIWSAPTPYLSEYRNIERTYQMCEIGMFRSPDGNRIIGLARSQSHNNPATLIYSDDEGETWSKPMDLPGSLAGERHKATYDPISGRLVITFRQIKYDLNNNNLFDGSNDWTCGDWMAWVGSYEDLINQNEGDYCFTIAEDFSNSAKSGDTGYAGVVVLDDGTFIMDSYGHFDQEFSNSWSGSVTTDLCYIKQAKFKLGEIENDNNLISKEELNKLITEIQKDMPNENNYTEKSYVAFKNAYDKANKILTGTSYQQVEVDNALKELQSAYDKLEEIKDNVEITDGKDQTITIGSDATFITNVSNERLVGIKVDGKLVDANNYVIKESNITLKKDYIKTLETKKHTITFVYKNGEVSTEFTVIKKIEINKEELNKLITEIQKDMPNENNYTEKSYVAFKNAYDKANKILTGTSYQQVEVDNALKELQSAYDKLEEIKDNVEITDGKDQTITIGSDATFITNVSNERLVGIKVDGKLVDANNYVIKESNITLKKDYIKTLETKKHTITFVYKNGEVSTEFTVIKKIDGTNNSNTNNETVIENNPKVDTDDKTNLELLSLTGLISILIITGLKKKKD